MERQYSTFHGMSDRDDYRTVTLDFSRPGFHFKIDAFVIHVETTGLDLIVYWKTGNYRKVIFLNLNFPEMCLMTYFFLLSQKT